MGNERKTLAFLTAAACRRGNWQLFGKGEMYDINDRINYIWNVSAHEVKIISREIFAAPLTMVLYTNEPHYSYKEVQEKLK